MRGPSLRRIQDFPGCRQLQGSGGGGHQHIIWPNFAENCVKMKEIGPRGRGATRPKFYYADLPLLQVRKNVCLAHTELGLSSIKDCFNILLYVIIVRLIQRLISEFTSIRESATFVALDSLRTGEVDRMGSYLAVSG